MKLFIHGPREGQTIKLNGVQFINGVAEHPTLLKNLERYYNVKDYPPNREEALTIEEEFVQDLEVSTNNEQADSVDDGKVLKDLVESKKKELSKDTKEAKDWRAMPWFTAKGYVKEMTGKSPKDKKTAEILMKEAGFD